MSTVASLMVKINGDMSGLEKSIQGAQGKLNAFGDRMVGMGGKLTAGVTAPIVAAFAGVGKAAMDLESTEAKFNTVFSGMTDDASGFIEEFQKLTPLTKAESRGVASGLQDLLVPMGFAREEATALTGDFMPLIGALANFNNSTHTAAEVANAVSSALVGEYEPMRRLGVVTNRTAINERVLAEGMASTKDEITDQMRAMALHQIITESSADAIAAYTEENLDAKTKMGLMKAELIDVVAKMGQQLLPTITNITEGLRGLIDWFFGLSESQQRTIGIVLAVVAALGPLLIIIGMVAKGVAVLAGVMGFILSPIGLIIAAVAGLVAAFLYFYNTNETFRNAVVAAWEWIKSSAETIWNGIAAFFTAVAAGIQAVWETHGDSIMQILGAAWDQVKNIFETVFAVIGGLIKFWVAVFKGDWQGAGDALRGITEAIARFIGRSIKNLVDVLSGLWTMAKTNAIAIWTAIKDAVINKAKEIYDGGKRRLEQLWDYIKSIPRLARQWGADILNSLWSGIKSKWDTLKSGIADVANSVKNFFNPWERQSPSLIDNIRSGVSEIEKLYSSIKLPEMRVGQLSVAGATAGYAGTSPIAKREETETRKVSIDMRGLFDGANVNIGSESDAKAMAREIYNLLQGRARSEGVVV